MIERDPTNRPPGVADDRFVVGDAADEAVLRRAGIMEAPAVILTSHDDATSIYLTILLRRLRPDIQILCRATGDLNVRTLHRAGADFVMGTASLGASRIVNLLRRDSIVAVAEGLNILRVRVPSALAGRPLAESDVRAKTGATIVAAVDADGNMRVNPDPNEPLPGEGEILLIGDGETEQKFADRYGPAGG